MAPRVRAGDPGAERLRPAVQLGVDDARGRGLQPLRDWVPRPGRRARHRDHGHHRRGHLARRAPRPGRRPSRATWRGALGHRMAGISIDRVSKRYDGVVAVRDLSLEVRDREFLTLLGPSGCGKTTLLRLIAGFLTPDAGTIRVDGRTI